jgi:hypothetical protein
MTFRNRPPDRPRSPWRPGWIAGGIALLAWLTVQVVVGDATNLGFQIAIGTAILIAVVEGDRATCGRRNAK